MKAKRPFISAKCRSDILNLYVNESTKGNKLMRMCECKCVCVCMWKCIEGRLAFHLKVKAARLQSPSSPISSVARTAALYVCVFVLYFVFVCLNICNNFVIIVVIIIWWQAVALIRFHRPNKKSKEILSSHFLTFHLFKGDNCKQYASITKLQQHTYYTKNYSYSFADLWNFQSLQGKVWNYIQSDYIILKW